jgi:cytoskeletal protein CcmA (bactofilin family)
MIWRREDAEPEHAEAPRVPAPPERKDKDMAENGEVTIVGTGARLEGNVVSAGNLRIDGQVKGQINADGDVVLSPQSQVEADIRSQNVSVAGRFKGNILVKGRRTWRAAGDRREHHVEDPRRRRGGIFHGQSNMDAGDRARVDAGRAAVFRRGPERGRGEEARPGEGVTACSTSS